MAEIFAESFEGAGYENGGWAETIGAGNTVDEDSVIPGTPPIGAGSQCLKTIQAGTNANAYASIDWGAGEAIVYARAYIYVDAWDTGNTTLQDVFVVFGVVNNLRCQIRYTGGDGLHFRWEYYDSGEQAPGITAISENTWYRVEMEYNSGTNAWEFRVDGATKYSGVGSGLRVDSDDIFIGQKGSNIGGNTVYFDLLKFDDTTWVGAEAGGGETKQLAGTIAGASSLSGAVNLMKTLAGESASVSALSGAIDLKKTLAGESAGESNLSGAINLTKTLSGEVTSVSALSGALRKIILLAGQISGQSSLSGAINLTKALAGLVAGLSDVSGAINVQKALAGSIDAISALSGTLSIEGEKIALAGVINAVSSLTGTLSTAGEVKAIGLWRLNKGSGLVAYDTSGNGNDGTLEGTTPTWVDGKSGKAVNLPGVNERIDCGNGAPLDQLGNGSFWLSFWMKSKDTVPLNLGALFDKYQGVLGFITLSSHAHANRIFLEIGKDGNSVAGSFSVNSAPFDTIWNHVVLVINRTTDKALLYINTVKDATEIDISALPFDISNTGRLAWGAANDGWAPFEGILDEMRIYTGVPTQEKIDFLHDYPSGIIPEIIEVTGSLTKEVLLSGTLCKTKTVTGKFNKTVELSGQLKG